MNDQARLALIDRLRAQSGEQEWFEFKRNHYEPEVLGEYVSALANAAALANQPRGYLVFGIDDESHDVVGTSFDPYMAKAKGNQALLPWLVAGLRPHIGVEVNVVERDDRHIVLFGISPAVDQPVSFRGTAFIRIGSSKTELSKHPEKERALWNLRRDWSGEVCTNGTPADLHAALHPDAVKEAREEFLIKNPTLADEAVAWDVRTFLNKARVLKDGALTNAALLLLGRPEVAAARLSPFEARITWVLKDERNRELDHAHFSPPFLLAGELLERRVRNLTVQVMPHGTLFPREVSQYDPWVLREALHNCIAHQDYHMRGRVVIVEFPDRVLLDNLGEFLPGDVETVIQRDAPQSVYRNPWLANAMTELNVIDTRGGGIKRMFETQRARSFALPDYDLSQSGHVRVTIPGRIIDEAYNRLLMERTDLPLHEVMLLDRVQKGRRIGRDDHRRLKAAGLVEGRYPNLMVAGVVAKATGETGRHVRERGFDKRYYLDLILTLLREHGPVSRRDVDEVLVPKLPDRLTASQKRHRVRYLLQQLRLSGSIVNRGTRSRPAWVLSKNAQSGLDKSR